MTINSYSPDWLDQLRQQVNDLHKDFSQARVYACIEGVHDESCYPLLQQSGCLPHVALYANTPNANEETLCISPILVEYRADTENTWNALLLKTDGKPALSLIATPESLTDLARQVN